jgi:hypothetical protein
MFQRKAAENSSLLVRQEWWHFRNPVLLGSDGNQHVLICGRRELRLPTIVEGHRRDQNSIAAKIQTGVCTLPLTIVQISSACNSLIRILVIFS